MITTRNEINLAKLYVFLLPFRMFTPFLFLEKLLGPIVDYADALLHIIGLMVWAINEGGFYISSSNRPLFNKIRNSIFYLNFSSFVMAFVMLAGYGYCNGVSPFRGILPQTLFYFQYILIFLYNIRVFSILSYNEIVSILKSTCRTLLVIGYIQVAVMNGIGTALYDTIANTIGGTNPSSLLPKLCLTGSEGASAGSLLGIFVIPFVLSRILHGDKTAKYELLLWLIPIYYTRSSTAMMLFFMNLIIFTFLKSKESFNGKHFIKNIVGLCCIVGIVALVVLLTGSVGGGVLDEIEYLVFRKAFDQDNGSTISRNIPLILNWGAFTEMPLLGVGNGLQGYFFNKYFPREYMNIPGSDVWEFYEIAQTGIANGGCFWPGYLSGYGIAGLIVLAIIIVAIVRQWKQRQTGIGIFSEMFIMGALCFFPCGMQGELYATYYAWFVISLPFMCYNLRS